MAIALGQASMANGSAQNGHDMMVEIRRLLLAVGLVEVPLTAGYDASESGDASQVPTDSNGMSSFMAFAFSDAHQGSYPIVVRFRVGLRDMGSSSGSYQRYRIQLYASEGLDESDNGVGRSFSSSAGGSYSSSSSYRYIGQGNNAGSFVRYTGDALTFVFGLKGVYGSSLSRYRVSSFLHIERNRDMNGGVIPGFSGTTDDSDFSTRYGNPLNTSIYFPKTQVAMSSTSSLFHRAGGDMGMIDAAAQVVAPAYTWSYTEDKIIQLRNLYTVGKGVLNGNDLSTVTLDFTGEPKKYLIAHPEAMGLYPGYSDHAWVFAWE